MPSFHILITCTGFVVALVVTLGAAGAFAARLDRLGEELGLTEALIGVLTALAADSPELASSVSAIVRGQRDVGLGVVFGSNLFNLAAMVGVGALVAGSVRPRRSTLAIESTVAVALLALTGALLAGALTPVVTLLLALFVVIPYVAILVLGDGRVHRLPLPSGVHTLLRDALGSGLAHPHTTPGARPRVGATLPMLPLLGAIVAGAAVMVDTSLTLADTIGLSHALVGLLILAVVTSLPNMSTAIRLARQGRGDATVSEALNSNTINLVGGILIPTLILGLGTVPHDANSDMLWLAALTIGTIGALAMPHGMRRTTGAILIAGYIAFVASRII
jgi:cation:H+ antiporter